ncbi:succinate dehydrogenase assembly factor 2 [Pseudohalocynthiibacter aestuariivivens]|nr:succinate dehydrogenase assembly factor 2 [Pseudohalocynthiibacter aestuariivivens]QIE47457.1 succinate dehydrogenase assembly factor 2 [Pseudohalocynthiibacter aestuariivivens]
MRSIRRGTKEMDIVLSRYAAARLEMLDSEMLALYEALLEENDQDLYQWVSGQVAPPARFEVLAADIVQHGTEGAATK